MSASKDFDAACASLLSPMLRQGSCLLPAAELDAALARARAADLDVIDLTPDTFPLPSLAPRLRALRDELVLGRGVYLFRGLPVQRWDRWETCAAFYGMGTHMGWACPQNAAGHVLGHVPRTGSHTTASAW